MENFIITIARGFGTGGREIGGILADRLHVHSYEHRILTLASQMSGYDEHMFEQIDEKLSGTLVGARLLALPKRLVAHPEMHRFTRDDRIYGYESEIIRSLAESESCIIIGKCADYVLKDKKNVLSVYIEAPREYCRPRIMKKLNKSPEEAHEIISKTDKYRAAYYKYYTHGNYWTNPVNYDLTLNPARLGEENCVDIIIYALMKKMGPDWEKEFRESLREKEKEEAAK